MAKNESVSTPQATHVRYGVLGFACALSMITYLDRVAIASASSFIVRDLHLNSIADLRWAFSAFALAYGLFEVPSGWLGDRFGPRNVLIRIVLWWSLFTAITGMVGMTLGPVVLGGLGTLIIVRFMFGIGEAGAYPNITRALHNWFPYKERGLTQGTVWFSGKMMGGLTPLIWMMLVAGVNWSGGSTTPLIGWRTAFWIFGGIGLIWCIFFTRWFRNRPQEKPEVNAAELAIIHTGNEQEAAHAQIPWKKIFTSGNLWFLCMMYAFQAYGWYFNITYLPRFLEEQYAVSSNSIVGALYKGGPLWMGAIGALLGGFITDWFIRRTGNRRLGRRICGFFGHGISALSFFLCPLAPNAFWFFLAVSVAAFCTDLTVASAWAICQDIGRRYAAIVGGVMNTMASLSGAVAGWSTGYVLQHSLDNYATVQGVAVTALSASQKATGLLHGYHVNFYIFGFVYVLALLCWFRIDSTKPIVRD